MRVAPERPPGQTSPSSYQEKHRVGKRWRLWVHVVRYIRACFFLVNIRTILLAAFACMMVYLCQTERLALRFRMEFSIVSVGTVFPLVFSIQQAFQRREEALRDLSMLKGVLMGLYFCHRDWDVSDGIAVRVNLGNDESPHAVRCAQLIHELLTTMRLWLCGRTPYESEAEWRLLYGTSDLFRELTHHLSGDFFRGFEEDLAPWDSDSESDGTEDRRREDAAQAFAERDPHWQLYYKLYDVVSKISVLNEQLMVVGMCTKAGEAGFSRLAAYLAKTVEVLERLRCIREHRTPFMLRYVSFVLVMITIVLGAPYFAFMCVDSRWEDDTSGSCPAGYFTAVLYVLVLTSLFHVQVALENPFDGIGVDDVFVNMDREFAVTVRRYIRSRAAAKAAAAEAAERPSSSTTCEKGLVEQLKPAGALGSCSFVGAGDSRAVHAATQDVDGKGAAGGGCVVKSQAVWLDGTPRSARRTVAPPPPPPAQQPLPTNGCSGGGGGGDGGRGGGGIHPTPGSSKPTHRIVAAPYVRASMESDITWDGDVIIPGAGQ